MAQVSGTEHSVQIRFHLDEANRPHFEYHPEHLYVRPGDRIEWTFEQGPFALQPTPISPFRPEAVEGKGGEGSVFLQGDERRSAVGRIRDDAQFGKYANLVAVFVDGRVWIDDPHFYIQPE